MNPERLASMATSCLSLDTETYAIRPDLPVPPVVLGSIGWLANGRVEGRLLDKRSTLETFAQVLEDERIILSGANVAGFDAVVLLAELSRLGIDAFPAVFKMFADDRVFDIMISQALNAIADGTLNKDPRTGRDLVNPETGKRGRFSLAICTDLTLDRRDAKANDSYRLRYGEFDGVPLDQLPQEARDYPVDDARNTHEVTLAHLGILPRVLARNPRHQVDEHGRCLDCGTTNLVDPCRVVRPNRNLHGVAADVRASFALSLGAAKGFRIDQSRVDIIERYARRDRDRGIVPFIKIGFIREAGTEDRTLLKRRVAVAYGATEPCPVCNGTGQVPKARQKTLQCPDCKGWSSPEKQVEAAKKLGVLRHHRAISNCARCSNTGRVPHPNPEMTGCIAFERDALGNFVLDDDGEPIKIKTCDGTGLVLTEDVPRSDKDGISYGGSTLQESGDEDLMAFGDYKEDAKTLASYVPYLRTARVPEQVAADGTVTRWRDIALTLRPNPTPLKTERVSYDGLIQTIPKWPGYIDKETKEYVPSLRECFVASPGRVLSSEDYQTGELFTHAQSCIWLLGRSDLATKLLNGVDPHAELAADTIGTPYHEFLSWKKQGTPAQKKQYKGMRDASKPITFGRPAAMGPPKIVHNQRKQGPDTPCPNGPSWMDDGNGEKIRCYKGMRYCILVNGAERCGVKKTTRWGKRGYEKKIAPTCVECLECAQLICSTWTKQSWENPRYFDYIGDAVENGQLITEEMLERWPHARHWFRANERLAPGEVMQHVSCLVHGGLEYSAACNGFFQRLLALATKAALFRVSRECYDKTIRIPTLAYANSRPSLFAGGPSPLYGTSDVISFMHDELLVEHDEPVAHEGATRVSEILVEELAWMCPDVAPGIKADPTLMRSWNKGAEAVRDSRGRLIPWEDRAQ